MVKQWSKGQHLRDLRKGMTVTDLDHMINLSLALLMYDHLVVITCIKKQLLEPAESLMDPSVFDQLCKGLFVPQGQADPLLQQQRTAFLGLLHQQGQGVPSVAVQQFVPVLIGNPNVAPGRCTTGRNLQVDKDTNLD